jgi:hypothetical protein
MTTPPPASDPFDVPAALGWGPPRTVNPPWTTKLWEPETVSTASPLVLPVALLVGVLAALTLRMETVGSALLACGTGVLVTAFVARGRRPGAWDLLLAALAVALAAVGTLRAAEWLVAVALAGAVTLGTLALVGARTWTGVAIGVFAPALAPTRTLAWLRRTLATQPIPNLKTWAGGVLVAGVTITLLATFGALFVAADPAFGELVDRATPSWDVPLLVRRLITGGAVGGACLLAGFLAQRPPTTDVLAPDAGKPVQRWAWIIPLALLDLLFLIFVAVQVTVLFGGRDHVLHTAGLSFAEYARQGFGQLLAVTVLTLGVVAGAVRVAGRTALDRALIRGLLGSLCGLALVVVASALHRMSLYEREFGFTRLRVAATAIEIFGGAVLVLLLIAGVRMSATWLPRAVVGTAAATVLGLAALNPDGYIAEHNVDRFERTGRIDVAYLATLSADAVPALDRLPAGLRDCALRRIDRRLRETSDPWFDTNTARNAARSRLDERPVGECREYDGALG